MQSAQLLSDELVGALDARGVPFLTGGVQSTRALALSPTELLQGLARDVDARLRLAVIPLLLVHPDYAEGSHAVAAQLEGDDRLTFQCYYTAAHWLQRKYAKSLFSLLGDIPPLPDVFSSALGLTYNELVPDAALDALSRRHQQLSSEPVNWRGTYEHAAQTCLKQLALEKTWAR